MTIVGLTPRVAELGRIRMGEKGAKGEPVRLRTFRLTSGDKTLLEAAARLYGGTVRAWSDAPDEGQWQLTTDSPTLRVLVPRLDGVLQVYTQAYELWQGGTCSRRCDGVTESLSGQPCLCDPADRECEIITRLNLMLPDLPGLGVWRLDTGGWVAATTLPSTLTLLAQLSPGEWMPAVLRAEQRSRKVRENGRVITHRFVVPALDLPNVTIGQLVGTPEAPALPEGGGRPAPPTAAQRAQARAAQITSGGTSSPPGANGGGTVPPSPAAAPDEPSTGEGAEVAAGAELAAPAPSTTSPGATRSSGPASAPGGALCGSPSPYGDQGTCGLPVGHPARLMCTDGSATWARPAEWR